MYRFILVAALAASSSAVAAQQTDVKVTLTEWRVRLSVDTVPAGTVSFELTNMGQIAHALQVTGPGTDKSSRQIAAREKASLSVVLKPGTYEVSCPLAEESHKMAGMKRTLIVVAAAGTTPAKKPGS